MMGACFSKRRRRQEESSIIAIPNVEEIGDFAELAGTRSNLMFNTKKYHVFAVFQLESIYLYFPLSSQLLYNII